ncbi:MAG: tetratricopeptide repeat protein, partial [Candidatus Kapaibacterium sp.]
VVCSGSLYAQNHFCDSTLSPMEAGKRHFYRGEYLQAIEDYNKIPNTDPTYGDVLYELAWAQYELGDYLQSISLLSDALYYSGDSTDHIQTLLAQNYTYNLPMADFAYELSVRTEEDIAEFIRRSEQEEDSERLYRLGTAFKIRGDSERAGQVLSTAISVRSDYWNLHEALGKLFLERGQFHEAAFCFVRALDVSPTKFGADRNMIRLENSLLASQEPSGLPLSSITTTSHLSPEKLRDGLSRLLVGTEKLDSTVQAYYVPWLRQIVQSKYLDCLVYHTRLSVDPKSSKDWISLHEDQMKSYLAMSSDRVDSLLRNQRERLGLPLTGPPQEEE